MSTRAEAEALAARAALEFPSLAHLATAFARWAAERHLDRNTSAELLVTFGCVQGDHEALTLLDARYLRPIGRTFARRFDGDRSDELLQELRVKLLCPRTEGPGRIMDYRGVGPLGAWLGVAARRLVFDAMRRARPVLAIEECPDLPDEHDPESELAQRDHRAAFGRAVLASLGEQPDYVRSVLRARYLEGQSIDVIAARTGVHRTTVARHLASARSDILARTSRHLREELALDDEADADEVISESADPKRASVSRILAPIRSALDLAHAAIG